MIAVGLTLALFVFWTMVGYGVTAALHPRRHALQDLLLAPVVGFAVTVVSVFLLSRTGLPVSKFGPFLAVALLLLGGILLWRFRPETPLRRYAPFAGVFLLGLFLTGRPLLEYGFDWLSYCNDDMANYCLGAQRFHDHGFADIPDKGDLLEGRDYTLCYWFMHVPIMVRAGSEMTLAWVVSLTGLTVHQAFMPLILAFYLMLLSSSGALLCPSEEARGRALVVCLLLAISALTTLGAVYQLIAQVAGVSLLAGCGALLLRPYAGLNVSAGLRLGVLSGVMGAAVFVVYPEVSPFLGFALVVYLAVGWWCREMAWRPLLAAGLTGGGALLILLNSYAPQPFVFLSSQLNHTGSDALRQIAKEWFPCYLLPSGPAALWGFIPFSGDPTHDETLPVKIVASFALLAAAGVAAVASARRREPAAFIAVVMFGVCGVLFASGNGFGLFKLAMFAQPFLLGALTVAWFSLFRNRLLRVGPLLALGLLGVATQWHYVEGSRGVGAAFTEVRDPSRTHINEEFRKGIAAAPAKRFVIDSINPCLVKFGAIYLRGIPSTTPGARIYDNIVDLPNETARRFLDPATVAASVMLGSGWVESRKRGWFDLHEPEHPDAVNPFTMNRLGRSEDETAPGTYLVAGTGRQSIVNRSRCSSAETGNFVIRPWGEFHNHLMFTCSHRGLSYYGSEILESPDCPIAMFQLEGDPMIPGGTMSACGRHLLFEVVNPSPQVRLVLSATTTVRADGELRLPPAEVVGDGRRPLGLLGRGSARVISPPLSTQMVDGRPFVSLDMGVDSTRPPERKRGLMRLYGKNIPIDRRKYVVYARDVSLISEEEYAAAKPPAAVRSFPDDLGNPVLEYSGVYENGWCSEDFFFRLTRPTGRALVAVRGEVPLVDDPQFTTEVRILVDGREVARKTVGLGAFEATAQVPASEARAERVEVHFSNYQRLPNGDGRPAAARLTYVGFTTCDDLAP
jgi:hypothetical protein